MTTNEDLSADRAIPVKTGGYMDAMRLWYFTSALIFGILMGFLFPVEDPVFAGQTNYGWPALAIGIVVGLIINIPVWTIFRLLVGVRLDVADLREGVGRDRTGHDPES